MEQLQEESVFAFPDFSKLFIIITDLRECALGSVLSQKDTKTERPMRVGALPNQRPDTVRLNESCWVSYGLWTTFGRTYSVEGSECIQTTNRNNDVTMCRSKETSSGVTRWKVFISQYNMKVVYRTRKENVVADCDC